MTSSDTAILQFAWSSIQCVIGKPRVLVVIAGPLSVDRAAIWARRQVADLRRHDVLLETYLFENRRSVRGLLKGGLDVRRRARDADLVHVHFGSAQALATVLLAGRPVVVSFCGSDLFGNYDRIGRKTWSGRLSSLLSRIAAIGATRAIAKSEQLRDALWPWTRHKCDVIPNGVDLEEFAPRSRYEARAELG